MFETIFILLAFVIFALSFERMQLGSIVGLLVAGSVIGPHGLSVIQHVETIEVLAELGVSFLLFNIGMELKYERLRLYGPRVYLLAISQLVVTTAILAAGAMLLGVGAVAAVFIGIALSLSSTALVLKALADTGRTITQLGRLAVAILLIQDIAVGPIVIVAQALGAGSGGEASAGIVLLSALLVAATIIAANHFILPIVLRYVTEHGSQEVFLATILIVVFASGWAMALVGSSPAIGAFLAGLAIAESPYRHQVAADVAPFRGLLLGIFFISVGADLNLQIISQNTGAVIALAFGIVLTKAVTLGGLALVFGHPQRRAVEIGALLSQGSEFSFVIFSVAVASRLVPETTADLLMAAVGLSLLIVAASVSTAGRLLNRVEGAALASLEELSRDLQHETNHVLVIGFGQVGMALTRHLLSIRVPVVVIDYSSKRVRESRLRGLPVYYGNALRADVLRSCGIETAQIIVVSTPDADVTRRILELVRKLMPQQIVIARAPTKDSVDVLIRAGADAVVEESLTTALELAERVAITYSPSSPVVQNTTDPEPVP